MSDEIEYIEPTQEHIGQMVEVRDNTSDPWIHCELLAVLPAKVPYRFCCYHEPNGSKVRAWEFAQVPRPKPQPIQEPPNGPIDWTKPVRTKDGRAVRVLCTDGPGVYQVIGLVDGECRAWSWTLGGIQNTGTTGPCDLENVPQRIQREYWANIYSDGAGGLFETKKDADRVAGTERIACVPIPIDCEKGEGL